MGLGYIEKQKPEHRELMYTLRDIILNSVNGFEEKHEKYLPVFHYLEACCFISRDRKGVYVAFVKGKYMLTQEAFSAPDTKVIRKVHYKTVHDIDVRLLENLIYEAVEINKLRNKKY